MYLSPSGDLSHLLWRPARAVPPPPPHSLCSVSRLGFFLNSSLQTGVPFSFLPFLILGLQILCMWTCSLRAWTGRDVEGRAMLTNSPWNRSQVLLEGEFTLGIHLLEQKCPFSPVFSKETRDKSFPVGSSEFLKGRKSLGPKLQPVSLSSPRQAEHGVPFSRGDSYWAPDCRIPSCSPV